MFSFNYTDRVSRRAREIANEKGARESESERNVFILGGKCDARCAHIIEGPEILSPGACRALPNATQETSPN